MGAISCCVGMTGMDSTGHGGDECDQWFSLVKGSLSLVVYGLV